ncbi:MAG: glycoside hydrolase 105 family protein, partial [Clostridiales bacterium]|nr:glycoside hydrolase 105 family protein [Clostridiales bacterium]
MIKVLIEPEQLKALIDRVVRKTMEMDLTWDWPCGVAYYG